MDNTQTPPATPPQPQNKAAIAQSIYPDPERIRQANAAAVTLPPQDDRYQQAGSAFNQALTIGLGAASSVASLLAEYFIKKPWVVVILGVLLAGGAIFFAIKDYRASDKMTPMTVIGLAAATTTLVYIGNLLVAEALVRSSYY